MYTTDLSDPGNGGDSGGRGVRSQDLAVIEHMMAGGNMLATQLPTGCDWTPEKRLAAAILASALVEIRDHLGEPQYRRRVAEDLEWVRSNDDAWPFSFVRLCALFRLDVAWVREVVARWEVTPREQRERPLSPFRQAA